jgi:phospholipid/cholesterol/gamma-HCH transport system ATP-binding protein
MTPAALLAVRNVSLILGERQVLHDVSFHVKTGETRVILGASGSGKTTILKLVLGLIKPDSGKILVDGHDIAHASERELQPWRQRMAMVFQGAALFDSLSVAENVGYRLWDHGTMDDQAIEKIVLESLRFVGLEDMADKMPGELSGGMRKRVGIARAVATGAEILLYDEPTAGLDPLNTCLISRLMITLKTRGATQVIVTHDLETAYRVADRIVMIARGRVLFDGTGPELQTSRDPEVRAFIDAPAMCDHEAAMAMAKHRDMPIDA